MNKGARFVFLVTFLALFMVSFAYSQTQVEYFHGIGCPHCAIVQDSGVLEKVSNLSGVSLVEYEVYYDVKAQEHFKQLQGFLNVKSSEKGVPFMMINCSGKYIYLVGDTPIIDNAENYARTCDFQGVVVNTNGGGEETHLTIAGVIVAALIDSINPCAFGVLIFLMISMLKVGSAKRALRYGLIYSFFVFLTYFLAGFGIFKVIQSISVVSKVVYGVLGIFILIMALLEFFDYFQTKRGKTSVLKIPTRAKPLIEKVMTNGTLPAIVLAGILVSLFELPCTGGIYLAILTSMAQSGSFSIFYLVLYNLIFVLPLVLITYLVYRGESTQFLHEWTERNKKWMKLVAGIILVLLGWYILNKAGLF
jgi:cytochrome c biogenesis protein CcdA